MKEKPTIKLYKNLFTQAALTSDNSSEDVSEYIQRLDEVSKLISNKLNKVDQENYELNEEVARLNHEVVRLNNEFSQREDGISELEKTCEESIKKLKDLQEKYDKEQKRANLLEVENNRNLDELKNLRKERNELMTKVEKKNVTLKDKIKNIINNG